MAMELDNVITELESMTPAELRRRYAELFGESAPTRHRQRLMRRILWRLQAVKEGDLSERARRRARELADDAELRLTAPRLPRAPISRAAPKVDPRLPRPGSVITRLYKERLVEVTVTRNGLLYEGRRYRSLSAVAGEVTGSHVNGFQFFGLATKRNKEAS